jgi:hypothetical protein
LLVVSEAANQGLLISPVPVALSGLTSTQVEMIGNGSYIVNAIGACAGCHGGAPSFLGGGCAAGDGGTPACTGLTFAVPGSFTVSARNLTPDPTTGLMLNVDQFVQALRTGADFHTLGDAGTPTQSLVVMPWQTFRWMSKYDLESIWWYLRSIPAVSNAVPLDVDKSAPPSGLPVEPTAYTAGDQDGGGIPLPPDTSPVGADSSAPVQDPGFVLRGLAIIPFSQLQTGTASYDAVSLSRLGRGSYIANALGDCSGCHTNIDNETTGAIDTAVYLTGGRVFDYALEGVPASVQKQLGYVRAASANLSGPTQGFFYNTGYRVFATLITQGIHAEDPAPQRSVAFPMPWNYLQYMTLGDLQALYTYMQQISWLTTSDQIIPDPAVYCDSDPSTPACPSGSICSSSSGPGECVHQLCTDTTVRTDCAVCQACSATDGGPGVCQVMTGSALGSCVASGYH